MTQEISTTAAAEILMMMMRVLLVLALCLTAANMEESMAYGNLDDVYKLHELYGVEMPAMATGECEGEFEPLLFSKYNSVQLFCT